MTQYSRTIGRIVTNALPAWRAALTDTNKVYKIGGLPSNAGTEIAWPAAGANNYLMAGGTDSNSSLLHFGYGSSLFVPELGAYGTMVFGTTGEGCITNQLTRFTLSDATPAWRMFQQPLYAISAAEAVTMDADAYYSEADYAALPGSKKIDLLGDATFLAGWDGTFPVGYKNWIIRRKYQTSFTGYNRPHWFRYNMPRYIPSSMTGVSAGAIVVNSRGTIYGPFGQGPTPTGATDSQWFADVWPSGRRKYWLHAMNVQTGAWQRLSTPIPDFTGYSGDIGSPIGSVDAENKRIYYTTYVGSNLALYYADFSAGLAGMTVSNPVNCTDLAGQPGISGSANTILVIPTSGPNAGRRLLYMRDGGATPALLLWELDTNTLRKLTITGLPTAGEWWTFSYRAATSELFITTKNTGVVKSYRMTIPADPTSAGSYSVSVTTLAMAPGVTLESVGGQWQYGERTQYLPELDVILMTQLHEGMLAYRPA